MKFLKKNKFTIFIIFFFLILFVLLLQAKNLFFPTTDDANYGDRLDGITEVSNEIKNNIKTKLTENEKVLDASVSLSGRILNIIITVEDNVSIKDAKTIGESSKEHIEETVLKDYDVQVFIKKNSTAENDFPIIGYKAKNNESFTWTKDREKVLEESEDNEE